MKSFHLARATKTQTMMTNITCLLTPWDEGFIECQNFWELSTYFIKKTTPITSNILLELSIQYIYTINSIQDSSIYTNNTDHEPMTNKTSQFFYLYFAIKQAYISIAIQTQKVIPLFSHFTNYLIEKTYLI